MQLLNGIHTLYLSAMISSMSLLAVNSSQSLTYKTLSTSFRLLRVMNGKPCSVPTLDSTKCWSCHLDSPMPLQTSNHSSNLSSQISLTLLALFIWTTSLSTPNLRSHMTSWFVRFWSVLEVLNFMQIPKSVNSIGIPSSIQVTFSWKMAFRSTQHYSGLACPYLHQRNPTILWILQL